jgi:lysine biosynthesis protein LysW
VKREKTVTLHVSRFTPYRSRFTWENWNMASKKGKESEKGMVRGGGIKKGETYCPECDGRIVIKAPRLGAKLTCHDCRTRLQVISLTPLELEWAE